MVHEVSVAITTGAIVRTEATVVRKPAVIPLNPARSESRASLELTTGVPDTEAAEQHFLRDLAVSGFGMTVGHEATHTTGGTAVGGLAALFWDRRRRRN